MILRPYQADAKCSTYKYLLEKVGNPLNVMPTGSGKTPLMAGIIHHGIKEFNLRFIVLAHVKELLEQGVEKLKAVAPDLDVGVYSASLGRKDRDNQVIFAQIQSAANICAGEFGERHMALVDEAHMIPPNGGTYNQFMKEARMASPDIRCVGFTATPYRLGTGAIYGPGRFFSGICYEIGVKTLIEQGYLCPLVTTLVGDGKIQTKGVGMNGGEFIASDLQKAAMRGDLVERAVMDMVDRSIGRKSILVFATGIKHAEMINAHLRKLGENTAIVNGETPSIERTWTVEEFKSGAIRWLVNIGVFTTGFDCPRVDCVVMLRPTGSAGLYYQMAGRGLRNSLEKKNCLILDYGGNIARHGPVDAIRVPAPRLPGEGIKKVTMRECPECNSECHPNCVECPDCGHVFKESERTINHNTTADSSHSVISDSQKPTEDILPVGDIYYSKHVRRKPKPGEKHINPTLKVEYFAPGAAMFVRIPIATEYVCIEHEGYAYNKAVSWWSKRSNDPMPLTVDQAVGIANHGGLACCEQITVRTDPKKDFPEITHHKLGPKPALEHDPDEPGNDTSFLDDMPF